jgi:hypothetical protein
VIAIVAKGNAPLFSAQQAEDELASTGHDVSKVALVQAVDDEPLLSRAIARSRSSGSGPPSLSPPSQAALRTFRSDAINS